MLRIFAIGGGGGGGGGRRGAVSTLAVGGGGGASGTLFLDDFPIEQFLGSSALQITIGAGGGGGAGGAADSTSGSIGTAGGDTVIYLSGFPNIFLNVKGGPAGSGGTNSVGTGGTNRNSQVFRALTSSGGSGGAGRSGSFGFNTFPETSLGLCGGAGGGAIDSSNNAWAGNSITAKATSATSAILLNAGIVQGSVVAEGGPINSATGPAQTPTSISTESPTRYGAGFGGAGGGAGRTTAATNGGNGVRSGGGGGGGPSRNGFAAGAGGRGGDGYVLIMAWG